MTNIKPEEMESKKINTFLLAVMTIMLSLIAWMGNEMYEDQQNFNNSWSKTMTRFEKNQIIIEYRQRTLETQHDISNPPLDR